MAHNLEDKPRTQDIYIKEDYTFNSLFLPNTILQGLGCAGFQRPSPVQLKAIPLGRCGLDLIVKAKSGTGKTLVFTVIALETIDLTNPLPQVIILAPTREIAIQIEDVFKLLGKYFEGLSVGCFIGGLPIEDDIKKLKTCHVAIGAPGRMKALVEKNFLKTTTVRLFILDEADKLMEESFQPDINYIYNNLPKQKQILAVSATYPDELDKFLGNYMHSPSFVTPDVDKPLLLGLQQFVTIVKEHHNIIKQIDIKTDELVRLLSEISFTQCIVFFNFQTRAETLSNMLKARGWNALYMSGSQSQTERIKVIRNLKEFECRILLTTDLTARGIDASNVNLVINFEVPFKAVTYLHRMGRAGRYGSHGICVTIASEGRELYDFQKILGQIGGSELNIPKVPAVLDTIWKCDLIDLEKIESVIVDDNDDDNSNIKQTVMDLKVVYDNLKKLKVDETTAVLEHGEMQPLESKAEVSKANQIDDFAPIDCESSISAHILFPWVPSTDDMLSQPTGKNLLDNLNTMESKKRKVSDESSNVAKNIVSKNIALYNSAKLLTSTDLNLTRSMSESVGDYFNVLEEQNKKRERKMEKFFESYSCDDILKNIAVHSEAWSKSGHVNKGKRSDKPATTSLQLKENKQKLFNIGYDWITKKDQKNWSKTLSDYCSTEDLNNEEYEEETEEEMEEQSEEEMEEEQTEEEGYDYDPPKQESKACLKNSTLGAASGSSTWDKTSQYYDFYNIPTFNQLYDEWSNDLCSDTKRFPDQASANKWCKDWLEKLSSVTNYVQQNVETYLKSQYQQSTFFD